LAVINLSLAEGCACLITFTCLGDSLGGFLSGNIQVRLMSTFTTKKRRSANHQWCLSLDVAISPKMSHSLPLCAGIETNRSFTG